MMVASWWARVDMEAAVGGGDREEAMTEVMNATKVVHGETREKFDVVL